MARRSNKCRRPRSPPTTIGVTARTAVHGPLRCSSRPCIKASHSRPENNASGSDAAQAAPDEMSLPIDIQRREAHFIRGEIFSFSWTRELDISDAAFDRHIKEWDRIAWRLAARNRRKTRPIHYLAAGVECFDKRGCPGGCPERYRHGRDRLREG